MVRKTKITICEGVSLLLRTDNPLNRAYSFVCAAIMQSFLYTLSTKYPLDIYSFSIICSLYGVYFVKKIDKLNVTDKNLPSATKK